MINENLKRGLSLVCTITLLLGMVILPNNSVHATDTYEFVTVNEEETAAYREVTFSDFGISNQTISNDGQDSGELSGFDNLDGVAFTGKLQMGLCADMMHSFRLGGKGGEGATDATRWSGVGLWTEANNQLAVYYYTGVTTGNGDIVKLPIADYGITYDETNGFSEFKLRMTFDYIDGTSNIKLTISVNDKLAYDGVLTNAQNYFGNELRLWAHGGKNITVKSVGGEPDSYREISFTDFGILDQTVPSDGQISGELSYAENLDGVAFTGNLQMGLCADMMYSFRIGGKGGEGATDNTLWSGVGLWTEANNQLAVYYYTGVVTGNGDIVKLPIADYGITYDETNGYSEFKLRMTFDYIDGTADIKLTISVNDILAYDGVLTDAQNYFGNQLRLWGHGGKTITVESVEIEPPAYHEVTFSDFGVENQTAAIGVQPRGTLGSASSLDGVAVSGYITMGFDTANMAQSFRIGGTDATPYTGVGLLPNSENNVSIFHYSTDVGGTQLGSFDPTKYGVSFTDGEGFSEFLLRMTFDYIPGRTTVKLNVYINGYRVFNGYIADAASTLGTWFFAWPHNAPITLRSVDVDGCFDNETMVNKYLDSYFSEESATAGGFTASNFTDHWTVSDGVITRRESSTVSDTGNMAMLVLDDRSYKNFELSLSYYQAADANESLIIGVGASEKGKFFAEEDGNFGIAVTGRKLWDNLIALDSDCYLTEGWHTVTLTLTGRMLRVYMDGTDEVVVTALPMSYDGGYVYLAAGSNASSFKDFSIKPLAYGIADIGDANNNGKVDIADMVRLKKNLQDIEGADINHQYVDFDNNNEFSQDDFADLRQYLLGEEVKKTVTNGFAWDPDVMPIGGYYGPTLEHTTDEFFQALQDMGLNVITTTSDYCDYYGSPENCLKALELGDKYGIYTFVSDSYFNLAPHMTEEEIRNRLQIYNDYKYFAGIRLVDEPVTDGYIPGGDGLDRHLNKYTRLATLLNRVSGVGGYINLFPYYQNLANVSWDGYKGYVQEYMQNVDQQKMVSYDHYVFDANNIPMYFKNMSLIRDAAQEQNIPFWAFVQAGKSTKSGRNPSENQFYWNVNTTLAMGAKGIQYYPMLQPSTDVTNGLIYTDGTKSAFYDYAQTINQQIANMDHILMNSTHEGIIAVDSGAISNTADVSCRLSGTSFRELIGVSTNLKQGAIIGCFDYNGKTALYVVNNSTYLSQTINLTFSSDVNLTQYAESTEELGISQSHSVSLKAGSAVLLVVE